LVILAGFATGCASKRTQVAYWDRVSRLDCQYGTETVRDTVVVTGADGNRWALERRRTRCSDVAAP
jgi:hypothetical protein